MRNLASAIEKLRQYVKDDRNKPYYRVQWEKRQLHRIEVGRRTDDSER